MDASPVQLARTELDFLQRLLLDLQRRLDRGDGQGGGEMGAALVLAPAVLRWDGDQPPELDAQFGLGAAVQAKLGLDGMCAWRQWREERRKRPALTP